MAINANAGEYRSRVGLDNLYIAEVTQDDAAGYVADTPEYLAPAAEASQEPSVASETQYADDQPYDVMYQEGETVVNLTITGMPIEMLAKLSGKQFDAASGRMFDNNAIPPYHALSFRSKKSNGAYRYYQFLKGRFELPKEEAMTQGNKPDPKTTKLKYTAIRTVYEFDLGGGLTDSAKRVVGDTDTTNFSATGWFSQVQTPVVSTPSALALSSSTPADGATGVSVSADQVLTFNNALVSAATNGIVLFNPASGAVIAATVSLDATKKIATINPASSLGAATAYLLTYAVTDIYGQTLQGSINFTTA